MSQEPPGEAELPASAATPATQPPAAEPVQAPPKGKGPWVFGLALVAGLIGVGLAVRSRLQEGAGEGKAGKKGPSAVPVEAVPIVRGPIVFRRVFSGALEAPAQFVVSPKVGGRVEQLTLDLGDVVERGQVVAVLDDAEFVQVVAQAKADRAVSRANLVAAKSSLEVASRKLDRLNTLRARGITSESERDVAETEHLAAKARVDVSQALVERAESALESARIQLGYTQVRATWAGGADRRVVAERFVDGGQTVSANASLLRVVELAPLIAVIFVTERDYAYLRPGQQGSLQTDAFPGQVFPGTIRRIAPVFRSATRQARVEMVVENADQRLKPGMFVRVGVDLKRIESATLVPVRSLTLRDEQSGVFVLAPGASTARWRPVKVGVSSKGRVEVSGEGLAGRVVTLGQQLLEDGSEVRVAPVTSGSSAKP